MLLDFSFFLFLLRATSDFGTVSPFIEGHAYGLVVDTIDDGFGEGEVS